MEWTDAYNPFNSFKVLVWSKQLQNLANGKIPLPVTVDTDPTTRCNYNCIWCNAQKYRAKGQHTLSEEQLDNLVNIYSKMGVKSTCIAGGGEPTLNPHLANFITSLHVNNIETGIITNGSSMTKEQLVSIAEGSRWCGFSVDAGNAGTYVKVKGIKDRKYFRIVIKNIESLCNLIQKFNLKPKCEVAFKFLVSPDNINSIYEATRVARECGVDHFHLRPACVDNLESFIAHKRYMFHSYLETFSVETEKARRLETKDFKVYVVKHKFNNFLGRKVGFKKCRATPLLATFGADGYCHLCFDLRGKEDFIMCKHEDIMDFWGSDRHIEMIDSIDPEKCPRCTFGAYNEIIEKVFIEDKMCKNFP